MALNYMVYQYDSSRNAVVMTDMDGMELVINCDKTEANEATEGELLYGWVKSLPENYAKEMLDLYDEMEKEKLGE